MIPKKTKQSFRYLAMFVAVTLLFTSCEKEKADPIIEVTELTGISFAYYHVSAKIIQQGDYKVFDYGFEYTVGNDPENIPYSFQKKSLGGTIKSDTFSTTIIFENLYYQPNYKCFARAYIKNEKGTIYGNTISTDIMQAKLISVTPKSGRIGDTITLNGQYFDPVLAQNTIRFDQYKTARIIDGSSSMLRVIVPQEATYWSNDNIVDISITVRDFTSTLENIFTIKPTVYGFSPTHGNWSTSIGIQGEALSGASIYFNDTYITDIANSSVYFNIPNTFLTKKFKIFLDIDGEKTEVPGGYFTIDDLILNEPFNNQCYKNSYFNLYGSNFREGYYTNKLFLGDYTIVCNYAGSWGYVEFLIPNNIPLGTYTARCTNGLDTVTLNTPIQIIGK